MGGDYSSVRDTVSVSQALSTEDDTYEHHPYINFILIRTYVASNLERERETHREGRRGEMSERLANVFSWVREGTLIYRQMPSCTTGPNRSFS